MRLLPAQTLTTENAVHHADLFSLCNALPSKSVDMILCDLPYGTTSAAWDSVIPLQPMWKQFNRVIKPKGAIVLTANDPFTSILLTSNLSAFKYRWIWVKNKVTGFANAKKQPLRRFEDVLVFGGNAYYPQGLRRVSMTRRNGVSTGGSTLRGGLTDNANKGTLRTAGAAYTQEFTNYPDNVLMFDCEVDTVHGTQKPVALFRYLIRTYTQAGELVLDPTCGSGTTAIAAREEGRRFICGDLSAEYVEVARKRLAEPYTLPLFAA